MRISALLIIVLSLTFAGCGRKAATSAQSPAENAARQPDPAAPLILGWHFVGGNALQGNNDASVLRQTLSLPAATEYREALLAKLAACAGKIKPASPTDSTNEPSTLVRPLLDDLLSAESCGEVRGKTGRPDEFMIGVKLPEERAQVWNSNLLAAAQIWAGSKVTVNTPSGWEIKGAALFRLARVNGWLLFGAGRRQPGLFEDNAAAAKETGRPVPATTNYWLEIKGDLPGIVRWLDVPLPGSLPGGLAALQFIGEGEFVRVKGTLKAAHPFTARSQPWIVPTNLIREPLVSFTAGQGAALCLLPQEDFAAAGLAIPGQFYCWAQGNVPFQTYTAAPVADSSNALARAAAKLIAAFPTNPQTYWGSVHYEPTNQILNWTGLPFVAPSISAFRDDSGEYLFAGLFPNMTNAAPMPAELLGNVLLRTNLVYYDWEITQDRLVGWRNLKQLIQIISGDEIPAAASSQKWLTDISQKLGNTITEVTQTSPDQLSVNRKGHLGLTGFELVTLTEWLDSPRFPGGGPIWSLRHADTNQPPLTP